MLDDSDEVKLDPDNKDKLEIELLERLESELFVEENDEISDIDELLDDELEKELRVEFDEDELNISFFHPLIL